VEKAPINWVAAALVSIPVAFITLGYGTSRVQDRASLEQVSGVLEDSSGSCSHMFGSTKCWSYLCLRTAGGRDCLAIEDTQLSQREAKEIRTGELLAALGWRYSQYEGAYLTVWELRRGATVLVSYEQSAADARARRLRSVVLGVLCLGLSAFGLGKGLIHWLRWRSWEA
jgi:hypothetical protein